jgi:oxygen-independent coproporphyrinogen-3 oxidase
MSDLYQGYAYAYPHKSAYRPFPTPLPLKDIWANEDLSRGFLYLHVPFCEMRCGFCNLFTMVNPDEDLTAAYLKALFRQIDAVAEAAPHLRPARLALGGGTPTWLEPAQLDQVFDRLARAFGARPADIPTSVETSPRTATAERLDVLAQHGVERISIGAQSFDEAEARSMGRPQKSSDLEAALDRIRDRPFRRLNIDLIYGAASQTAASWRGSIERALAWRPEEVFLYPLYVRPLTGLDGRTAMSGQAWDDHRLALYRQGRDILLAAGYRQTSMRCFSRADEGADAYCCQEDGMIGLGPGARSYAQALHYSSRYAVKRAGVAAIIRRFADQTDFSSADYGARLDLAEQMRRFILQSVFHHQGLDIARFTARFGPDPFSAEPRLGRLVDEGFLAVDQGHIRPTPAGLERSDALGPQFYSAAVAGEMAQFELQ